MCLQWLLALGRLAQDQVRLFRTNSGLGVQGILDLLRDILDCYPSTASSEGTSSPGEPADDVGVIANFLMLERDPGAGVLSPTARVVDAPVTVQVQFTRYTLLIFSLECRLRSALAVPLLVFGSPPFSSASCCSDLFSADPSGSCCQCAEASSVWHRCQWSGCF